jgi:hypothetical protein
METKNKRPVVVVKCGRCLRSTLRCPRCQKLVWILCTGSGDHRGFCADCGIPIAESCPYPESWLRSELPYHRTTLVALVLILITFSLGLLLFGCAAHDDAQRAECEARAELAREPLEAAIQRHAREASAGYYIIEGSGTWFCDAYDGFEASLDYDLVHAIGVEPLTMVLYDYDGLVLFEIAKREEAYGF